MPANVSEACRRQIRLLSREHRNCDILMFLYALWPPRRILALEGCQPSNVGPERLSEAHCQQLLQMNNEFATLDRGKAVTARQLQEHETAAGPTYTTGSADPLVDIVPQLRRARLY